MIEIRDLSKAFGRVKAVDQLSFSVKKGSFFGLLGPNGAGKTTTINMLSSLMQPDSGQILLKGLDLAKNPKACKGMIGVVPQEISLYEDLSALQNLRFWGGLYGLEGGELDQRISRLLRRFGLEKRQKDTINTYSGGMKRRINIAASLLHEPEIILMDEPTVGIDPQSRHHIYEVIEELHQRGNTIIYTTHYIEEAERFCEEVGIIDQGQIIALGSPDALIRQYSEQEFIRVHFDTLSIPRIPLLKDVFGDQRLRIHGEVTTLETNNMHKDMSLLLKECEKKQLQVERIELKSGNLEDVFLTLTGKRLRD